MQYDSCGNCNYCGYGPNNRNPKWCNWKQHCTLTHAYDPPENAVNSEAWEKIKLLPRNFNSGGGKTMILKDDATQDSVQQARSQEKDVPPQG